MLSTVCSIYSLLLLLNGKCLIKDKYSLKLIQVSFNEGIEYMSVYLSLVYQVFKGDIRFYKNEIHCMFTFW